MSRIVTRVKSLSLLASICATGCTVPLGGSSYPQASRPTGVPTASFAPGGPQSFNAPIAFAPGTQTAMAPIPAGTLNSAPIAAAPAGTGAVTYFNVRPGDSVSTVAQLYGVSEAEIRKTNNLKATDNINPGQLVRIPDGATAIR